MNNLINRVLNCISFACILLFTGGLSITIVRLTNYGDIDDEALVMTAFIIIPFVLNYIVGNGIKLFNRGQ